MAAAADASALQQPSGSPLASRIRAEVDESDYQSVGGVKQRTILLCKGWETIDTESKIQKVRAGLTDEQNACLDDTRILRFLLGHDCDVKKILGILQGTGGEDGVDTWSRKNNIPAVHEAAVGLGWERLPHLEVVQRIVPMFPCGGVARDGSPFSFYRFGMASISGAKKHNNAEDIEKIRVFSRHSNELGADMIYKGTQSTGRLMGIYQIIDLSGIGMKHIWNKNLLQTMLKPIIEEASKWYPETTIRTFLVNAPMMFRALWTLVKLWLDERQIYKCKVCSGVPDELKEIIGEDALPRCIGGKGPDPPILKG